MVHRFVLRSIPLNTARLEYMISITLLLWKTKWEWKFVTYPILFLPHMIIDFISERGFSVLSSFLHVIYVHWTKRRFIRTMVQQSIVAWYTRLHAKIHRTVITQDSLPKQAKITEQYHIKEITESKYLTCSSSSTMEKKWTENQLSCCGVSWWWHCNGRRVKRPGECSISHQTLL